MQYRQFVKENYDRVRHLPVKQRMAAIAKLWHAHKTGAKGAGLFGDIGNAVDGIGSLFGLGLEKQKKSKGRGRPRKTKEHTQGAGIFSDIGNAVDGIGSLFGLGLEPPKKGRGRPRKSHGGNLNSESYSDLSHMHGFGGSGLKKKGHKSKLTQSELMQLIAQHMHSKAKGGSLGDAFGSLASVLSTVAPLLGL